MNVHELKITVKYFNDVYYGVKKFEVRFNDKNFKISDILLLKEFDTINQEFTERSICKNIIYILDDPKFVKDGFIIMGIES